MQNLAQTLGHEANGEHVDDLAIAEHRRIYADHRTAPNPADEHVGDLGLPVVKTLWTSSGSP